MFERFLGAADLLDQGACSPEELAQLSWWFQAATARRDAEDAPCATTPRCWCAATSHVGKRVHVAGAIPMTKHAAPLALLPTTASAAIGAGRMVYPLSSGDVILAAPAA